MAGRTALSSAGAPTPAATAKPAQAAQLGRGTRRVVFVVGCIEAMNWLQVPLKPALEEVACTLQLLHPASFELGVMAYRNCSDPWVTRWSGWLSSARELTAFLRDLSDGRREKSHAAKTALKEVIQQLKQVQEAPTCGDGGDDDDEAGRTVVLWCVGEVPHSAAVAVAAKAADARASAGAAATSAAGTGTAANAATTAGTGAGTATVAGADADADAVMVTDATSMADAAEVHAEGGCVGDDSHTNWGFFEYWPLRMCYKDAALEAEHFARQGWSYDWATLCREAADAQVAVFPIMPDSRDQFASRYGELAHGQLATYDYNCSAFAFFSSLASATGGTVVELGGSYSRYGAALRQANTATTICLALALMGYPGACGNLQGAEADAVWPGVQEDLAVSGPASVAVAGPASVAVAAPASVGQGQYQQQSVEEEREEKLLRPLCRAPQLRQPLHAASLPLVLMPPVPAPAERFAIDEWYKGEVCRTLLATPAASIAHNPLYLELWQAVCADRRDERSQAAVSRIRAEVQGVESELRAALQGALRASGCNDSATARAEVEALAKGCDRQLPAVVFSEPESSVYAATEEAMVLEDVAKMFLSCSAPALRRLSTALTCMSVRMEQPPSDTAQQRAVSLALPAADFFSVLLHLASPGLVLRPRSAVVLALLALRCGREDIAAPLRQKALELVREVRGRWLDWRLPENATFGFLKLLMSVHEDLGGDSVMTEQEAAQCRRLYRLGSLKARELSQLIVRLPFTSHKTPRPDARLACSRCGGLHSFTLLDAQGVCPVCHGNMTADEGRQGPAAGGIQAMDLDLPRAPLPPANNCSIGSGSCGSRSHWCECSLCAAHYVVEKPEQLTQTPACHHCRHEKRPAPARRCAACNNKFVCALPSLPVPPASALTGDGQQAAMVVAASEEEWLCPPCATGEPGSAEEVAMTLRQYLQQLDGQHFLQPLGTDAEALFSSTLFDLLGSGLSVTSTPALAGAGAAARAATALGEEGAAGSMELRHKPVLNVGALRDAVHRLMDTPADGDLDTCSMCLEEMCVDRLRSACGRGGCNTLLCDRCLREWYGAANVPGGELQRKRLLCPFCQQRPDGGTLLPLGRKLLALKERERRCYGLSDSIGWCLGCWQATALGGGWSQGKAQHSVQQQRFLCRACEASSRRAALRSEGPFRACPSCGVMVEKVSGCDHITCPCGAHWCFVCSFEAHQVDDVYLHIYSAHGVDCDDNDDRASRELSP